MNLILDYLRKTRQNRNRRKSNYYKKQWGFPKKIVVIRVKDNELRYSRPCDHCICLLRYYGIKKVIYSTGIDLPGKRYYMENISEMEFLGPSKGNRDK